jgi:serine/threonine protein kinase
MSENQGSEFNSMINP